MRSVAFIGAGRVGTALAVHLARRRYPIVAIASRSRDSADRFRARLAAEGQAPVIDTHAGAARRASVVFITTTDRAIAGVAADLAAAGSLREGQIVAHTSGALSSEDVLQPASACGAGILAFHPLQSFATADRGVDLLPGCTIFLDGDPAGLEAGRELSAALGTPCLVIPTETKPLYHAAACMASNYLVTLLSLSLDVLSRCGLPPSETLRALLPLVRGTVENVASVGIPAALTGPVERGDSGILEGHLRAIAREVPGLEKVYRVLGAETVRLAAAKGCLTGRELSSMLGLFGVDNEHGVS
ncbi:MAG: Rossmann-like and DUF2520 domain-containing protein [Ignavibacteriales bacterium]